MTIAEEGKPEALAMSQGMEEEWQTARNEANLVRQRCNMREPTESTTVAEVRPLEDGDRRAARGGGMALRESIGLSGLARKVRSEARHSNKRTNLRERSVRTDMKRAHAALHFGECGADAARSRGNSMRSNREQGA